MKEKDKTKKEFSDDLRELRQQVERLERVETERKRVEEALHASEIRYRRLFETAKDGILILDAATGQIDDVNPFLTSMLGYTRGELLGKKLWEIGPFKDTEVSKTAFEELQRKEYIRYEHLPLESKGRMRRDVEFVSNVYQVNHKRVIQCNIRDITERKHLEDKLRESEERFRGIFEYGPLGMIVSDSHYRVLQANKAFCQMLGYSEQELVGQSIEDITYSEDIEKSATLSKEVFMGNIPLFQLEKRYVKKNGEILWIHLTATAIRNPEGKVLYALGMIEDISLRKFVEQERERLIFELKDALANIKTLKGLLPVCSWCKKVRDDRGYWDKLENYIRQRSDADFTHGICPECLKKEDPLTYEQVFRDEKGSRVSKTEQD